MKKAKFAYLILLIWTCIGVTLAGYMYYQNYLDKEHEKELLLNVLSDIENDIENLQFVIRFDSSRTLLLNELIAMHTLPLAVPKNAQKLYDLVFYCFSTNSHYVPHNSSFSQLKSTKGYNIIRNKALIDSLLDYESAIQIIDEQEEFYKKTLYMIYEMKYEIMDETIYDLPRAFDKHTNSWLKGAKPYVTKDRKQLLRFFNCVRDYRKETRYYFDVLLRNQLQKAVNISKIIRNEYTVE